MGFLSKIAGIAVGSYSSVAGVAGNIFGTEKAAERLVDSIASGLDKLHYGEQEKAEDRQKAIARGQNVILNWMESTKGQNIARRTLAMAVVFSWLGMYLAGGLCKFAAIWYESKAVALSESSSVFGEYSAGINDNVTLILMFYFAAPHIGKGVETVLTRLSKPKS